MNRREALQNILITSAGMAVGPIKYSLSNMTSRAIPTSGEMLPIVGIGTWQTFDVGNNRQQRNELTNVLAEVHRLGGKFIDSSPMYGSSEEVVGDLASQLESQDDFFYATKVWTSGKDDGIEQMNRSFRFMKREVMDLMQIHNLLDWEVHLKTLKQWKEEGKIRYWGITHYTNASHNRLAKIIKDERPDFVQFNYAINDRHAEENLLGVAADHGVAVVVNRPFGGGQLFSWAKGRKLPEWCKDYHINSWAQFFLKFILAHPAVTCVIPGTGKIEHAKDNLKAGYNVTTGEDFQKKLWTYFKNQ